MSTPDRRRNHATTALAYPDIPLHGLMRETAQRYPQRTAIRSQGQAITFAEFDRLSSRLANGFAALEVRAGFDDEGYAYVADRKKDMIKYKSFSIAPAELEAVLLQHPDVADCAVAAVPDAEAGEVPKAFVVARQGCPIDTMRLAEYVCQRVAGYKHIRRWAIVENIPRTPSGKLLRRALR